MARLTTFTHDGLTFDLTDAGPADGEVVLLLHGFPQDRSAWDSVAPLLHEAGLRTLAPDLRGYSPGARPAGRSAYALSRSAADLVALLDAAGADRAHVVGHDWGGALAWAFGAAHADRAATLTVVSTPHPAALTRSFVTSTQALRSWYMAFFNVPVVPEKVVLATLEQTLRRSGLPAGLARRYTTRMREPGAMSGALGWYRAIPWSLGTPTGRVRVPTTYVWGRKDFALGRSAAEATKDFVRAPYLFVEVEGGHWLPETRAGEVASAVVERSRHPSR